MQNGRAWPVVVAGNQVTIVDSMTRFVIVAVNLPDRWLFYKRPFNNEAGYARGKVWSYPHRAPPFTDEGADVFKYEFDRVNFDELDDRYESMAILSLLHDVVDVVPAQFDIYSRRMALVRRFPLADDDDDRVPGS
jgi:hypothetical protein